MKPVYYVTVLFAVAFFSCIGDDILEDFVEPKVRILNPIESIELGSSHQYEVSYFNNIGVQESPPEMTWSSSNTSAVTIDNRGLASVVGPGEANLKVTVIVNGNSVMVSNMVVVSDETVESKKERQGVIQTTSSYPSELGATTIFANNVEYTSLTIEGAYYITKEIGFSLAYGSAFSGKIILASPYYSVGIFVDLK